MTALLMDLTKHLLCVRYIDFETLRKMLRITSDILEGALTYLEDQGLIRVSGKGVEVIDTMNLAIMGLRIGLGHDTIANCLNWKDFERYVSRILEAHGYKIYRNLRGGFKGGKFEIDVFGHYGTMGVAVDCKHWKRTRLGLMKNHVERHISRVELFTFAIKAKVIDVSFHKGKILPIIVTLTEYPRKTINNVPIVPIFELNDFILNLKMYIEELSLITFKV